eukprot:gene7387-11778_t
MASPNTPHKMPTKPGSPHVKTRLPTQTPKESRLEER